MEPMLLSRIFLPLLVGAGLAAQQGPTHKPSLVEVPYGVGSGPFQRIEFLLPPYAPAHQRDAIVLRGGQLGHVRGIGVHSFVEPFGFPVAVSDCARIPQGNPALAGHDALLISHIGTASLAWVHWTDADTRVTRMFAMPGWQRATHLRVAPGASGYEIAAVAADGQTLLRGAGTAPAGTATVSVHHVGSPIRATALGDHDGDGELETLALTDTEVVVVRRNGTWLTSIAAHHDGGTLARTGGKVYWLRRNPADDGWELTVVAGADPILAPPAITVANGDFVLQSVVASDVDQDDEPDLVIAQSSTLQAIQVRVTDATPGVLGVEAFYVNLANQMPVGTGTTGRIGSADLDGDGYHDLVACNDAGSKLVIVRGTAHGRTYAAGPVEDLPDLLHDGSGFDSDASPAVPNGMYLRFAQSHLFQSDEFTHVTVNLWYQASSSASLTAQGQFNQRYEIDKEIPEPGEPEVVAHSVFIPLEAPVQHTGACFWHLEVVFDRGESSAPGTGLVFTIASYASADQEQNAPGWYLQAGDAYLDSIGVGAPVVGVYGAVDPQDPPAPPGPGRILVGGHCPTGGIPPPPLTKPVRATASTAEKQTVPIQNSGT